MANDPSKKIHPPSLQYHCNKKELVPPVSSCMCNLVPGSSPFAQVAIQSTRLVQSSGKVFGIVTPQSRKGSPCITVHTAARNTTLWIHGHLSKRPTVTPAFLDILADLFHIFPLQRVVKLGFKHFFLGFSRSDWVMAGLGGLSMLSYPAGIPFPPAQVVSPTARRYPENDHFGDKSHVSNLEKVATAWEKYYPTSSTKGFDVMLHQSPFSEIDREFPLQTYL